MSGGYYRGTAYKVDDLRPLDENGEPVTRPAQPLGFPPPKACGHPSTVWCACTKHARTKK